MGSVLDESIRFTQYRFKTGPALPLPMPSLRRTVEFEFSNESGNTAVVRLQEPGSWKQADLERAFARIVGDFAPQADPEKPHVAPAPEEAPEEEPSPWAQLDAARAALHGKQRNSIDQALLAVASINERGPAASYEDITKKAHLSYATVTKLFRDDNPAAGYVGQLFTVTRDGRSFRVDLTKAGRTMASRVRAI